MDVHRNQQIIPAIENRERAGTCQDLSRSSLTPGLKTPGSPSPWLPAYPGKHTEPGRSPGPQPDPSGPSGNDGTWKSFPRAAGKEDAAEAAALSGQRLSLPGPWAHSCSLPGRRGQKRGEMEGGGCTGQSDGAGASPLTRPAFSQRWLLQPAVYEPGSSALSKQPGLEENQSVSSIGEQLLETPQAGAGATSICQHPHDEFIIFSACIPLSARISAQAASQLRSLQPGVADLITNSSWQIICW